MEQDTQQAILATDVKRDPPKNPESGKWRLSETLLSSYVSTPHILALLAMVRSNCGVAEKALMRLELRAPRLLAVSICQLAAQLGLIIFQAEASQLVL